jgi:glucose-6-phosphate 1-dehydrogenase
VRVKLPGERKIGNDVELILSDHTEADMPPYQRLLGDAFKANNELFAREDFIDAQWSRNGASLIRSLTTSRRFIRTNLGHGDRRKSKGLSRPMGAGSTRKQL